MLGKQNSWTYLFFSCLIFLTAACRSTNENAALQDTNQGKNRIISSEWKLETQKWLNDQAGFYTTVGNRIPNDGAPAGAADVRVLGDALGPSAEELNNLLPILNEYIKGRITATDQGAEIATAELESTKALATDLRDQIWSEGPSSRDSWRVLIAQNRRLRSFALRLGRAFTEISQTLNNTTTPGANLGKYEIDFSKLPDGRPSLAEWTSPFPCDIQGGFVKCSGQATMNLTDRKFQGDVSVQVKVTTTAEVYILLPGAYCLVSTASSSGTSNTIKYAAIAMASSQSSWGGGQNYYSSTDKLAINVSSPYTAECSRVGKTVRLLINGAVAFQAEYSQGLHDQISDFVGFKNIVNAGIQGFKVTGTATAP